MKLTLFYEFIMVRNGVSGILRCVKRDCGLLGADIEIMRHYLESDIGKIIGLEYNELQGRIIYK